MINKEAHMFKQTLKGAWTPQDVFGTPMLVGEIILYGTGGAGGIDWRVGKIIEVIDTPDPWGTELRRRKLKMRRAHKDRGTGGIWTLQDKVAYLTNVKNAFVLTNPKPEIVELFKDV